MSVRSDALTRWWRRTSLRAKITGVTVGLLAVGLLAAGFGSAPLLRTMLMTNIDSSLEQLSGTNVWETVFDVEEADGELTFHAKSPAPQTEYIVAVYSARGDLLATAGGHPGAQDPLFPTTITVQDTVLNQGSILQLETLSGAEYHAVVSTKQVDRGTGGALVTQLVAMPLTQAESFVSSYIGIFTTMSLLTVILGALVTRLLVTLAFRRLGQVEETAMTIAEGDFSQRMDDIEPTTEVGRLKIAINTMLDRLDASFTERDEAVEKMRRFIGDASHELRTPLVSVRGYAELYRMGAIQGEDDTAKAMERIEKEAKRMTSLVEDLLALARLDERRELEISDVDLRRIARDAALDVRAADPSRQVTVHDNTVEPLTGPITIVSPTAPPARPEKQDEAPAEPATETSVLRLLGWGSGGRSRRRKADAPPVEPLDFSEPEHGRAVDVPPVVRGSEEKIQQVIANLLGNARRYSPPETSIELEVGVDPERQMGWIAVIDHGEGIPEEIRRKIFQRFWRADTSRTRETGGSGLGLAIVASIVENLDGAVSVFETPGGGATFQVAFPLAEPTAWELREAEEL